MKFGTSQKNSLELISDFSLHTTLVEMKQCIQNESIKLLDELIEGIENEEFFLTLEMC